MTSPRPEHPVTLIVEKGGDLCWLGHLDFARAIERALRRSGLPVAFTEGFHKRIKMRLPEPLPLGVGSDGERFIPRLSEPLGPEVVMGRLAGCLPVGLRLAGVLAGAHPEPLDTAIELEIESTSPLREAVAAVPGPAVAERVEILEAATGEGGVERLRLRLTPRPGARVSVGRLLESLRESPPIDAAIRRVTRRLPSNPPGAPLPSSPLSAPDESEDPSPCTR